MDDIGVDHYAILGLCSGEEGAKLSKHEITKAYRSKAKKVHPDKRPRDDSSIANCDFRRLQSSYELLMDDKLRKSFDDLLRMKREKARRQEHQNRKRTRIWSNLEERERSASFVDPKVKARDEEERRMKQQLDREVARIRAVHNSNRKTPPSKILKVQRGKKGTFYVVRKKPNLVGVEFQEHEDSVLEKMRRFAKN